MQQFPQPRYPWPPPEPMRLPRTPSWTSTPPTRAARVQQACDQCRARKRRCDAMQPCDNCMRENRDCVYIRSPNLKDDKLVNLITAVSEKLEHLSETVQRVDRAHRTTHQLLFSESKDHGPALKEHRTPAHNLLFLWQSIRALVDAAHIDVHGDYVARAEDRPLLDPFARRSSSRAFLECPRARLDTTLLPLRAASAPRICPPRRNPQEEAPSGQGGLTPDGRLDLRRSTLEALLAAYLANIHILHPFLNKPKLRVMLDAFIEAFPDDTLAKDHESPDETSSLGRKRKRSRFDEGIGYHDTHTASFHPPQQQRVENAIVWLVLALGKICLHKKPLPEVFDGSPDAEAILSPAPSRDERSRDISPSSVDSLSAATLGDSHASAHGFVSPSQSSKIVLGDWQEGPLASYERNVDAVPGLAYYTAATAVLGSQADGTSLAHAQIFALAGLYKGQLARVRESISWISRSAQVVRVLLHVEGLFNNGPLPVAPNVRKSTRHKQSDDKDGYQDAIKLTAWSALQLESDILAELSFPSSGLPALELVPYDIPDCSVEPHSLDGVRATAYDHETVVLFYSAQTFLRTRLNNAHDEIYGKAGTGQPLPQIRDMLRAHDLVLTEWRTKLPPGLRWEDKDPPSSNILHARLRAKYWGARYIITRPFLDYVMHIMPYITSTSDVERAAKDARGDPRDPAEVRLLEAIAGMPRSEIEAAVESCIDAAMQSTVAFDGIQDRLIVTNIHGTAHAQFGNVLVLAATYRHERLKRYVPRDRLRSLLDRTIAWLGRLAPISQTCKADCLILQRIQNSLFAPIDHSRTGSGTNEHEIGEREASCESEITVARKAEAPIPGSSQIWR